MREFMNDMLCLNLLLLTSAILIATKIPERKLLRTEAASVTFVLVEVANLLSFIANACFFTQSGHWPMY